MSESLLGKRVAELRKRAKLSRKELATLAGLAYSHIGLIENGKRENLRVCTVQSIADVLGADVVHLTHGRGNAPSVIAIRRAVDIASQKRGASL